MATAFAKFDMNCAGANSPSDPQRESEALAPIGDDPATPAELAQMADLMAALYEHCGVDFRDYAPGAIFRRIKRYLFDERIGAIADLRQRVLADADALDRLLNTLTLPVTSMFRDPAFFRVFREQVCPMLATYPFLRLWVAGCSTGQEAYSLAIVLKESGLLERSRIYATDLHPGSLQQAQAGVYPLAVMKEYTANYQAAGGACAFTDYYAADAEYALLLPQLRDHMVFATHNLTCDGSFNEFHVIFCRNVMIYFNERLQERVHRLLYGSLGMLGYLGLGLSESIRFSYHENSYEPVSKVERIYRKIR
jgi:chemotaxis protein methyltransferase CheR